MNQGRNRQAVTEWQQCCTKQQKIFSYTMYDRPLTWREKEAQRKMLLRNKKITNYCKAIEAVIIIGILWLVVTTLIERTM